MESSRIGVLAVLYNVCSYLFSPVLLCLNAVWYYETKSFLSEGDGSFTFLVFMMAWVPEGIFRLKWKIDSRLFVLFCVSLTALAQMWLGRLFFADAPMTRRMAFFITLMEFAWTIILELDEEFREYIISCDGFGYFVPCAQDSEISKLLLKGWDRYSVGFDFGVLHKGRLFDGVIVVRSVWSDYCHWEVAQTIILQAMQNKCCSRCF